MTGRRYGPFSFADVRLFAIGVLTCLLAGLTKFLNFGEVTAFLCAGVAVAVLALLVGVAVDQIAERLGAGATGVLQSALGNLPELFISIFALRAGLITVVQSAIVGSILANVLLVLGLAFVVGGRRNGPQKFSTDRALMITTSMVLAVGALVVPSLASYVHTPAAAHEQALSTVTAVVLLVVFVLSVPASLSRGGDAGGADQDGAGDQEQGRSKSRSRAAGRCGSPSCCWQSPGCWRPWCRPGSWTR